MPDESLRRDEIPLRRDRDQMKVYKTKTEDGIMKNLFDTQIGDRVRMVDSPGENPEDHIFIVTEKIEDRFGKRLVVKNEDGDRETVHSFTEIGIGWYKL